VEFFLNLLPPMLWAASVLTDKILVKGEGKDSKPAALMAISGLFNLVFGIVVLGPMMLWHGRGVELSVMLPLMANGITYITAMILFLTALNLEEASRVDPWFQTIPAFGIILAFSFIGESLEWYHVTAIAVLMVGGWVLKSSGKAKGQVIVLMLIASLLLAVNDVVFAKFGRELDTVPAITCDVAGKAFWGLVLLVGPKTRQGFVIGMRTKLGLQSLSEMFAIVADFLFDRAKLFAPVAIVQGLACSQPIFVLVGAALLTKFLPHLVSEEQGSAFWKKLAGIALIVIGGAALGVTT
jgi:uncharacterized membrane protein